MGNFFDTFLIQPVFNLLVIIYAVIPGHDLGIAIILFTALIRIILWPIVKKQSHQTKEMKSLQPEKLKEMKSHPVAIGKRSQAADGAI